MIKINLLRGSGLSGHVVAAADGVVDAPSVSGPRGVIAKIVLILLAPLAIYIWERYNLQTIDDQIAVVAGTVAKLQAEKAKYGDTGPRVETYTKEKQKVDHQLDIIRAIAKNRLREVKSLDALQSLIPQRTWLKKISIEDNLMKMEGYTAADDGVTDLMRALENSAYFSNVEPKDTSLETLPIGPVKKFNLELHIGKSEKAEI
jgi:Tfp pilus assembly protein PilN